MERGNILDIGVKAVRDSGKVNMFDRLGVQKIAFDMGFCELVTWIEENSAEKYFMLLDCTDFESTPDAPWEELLDCGDTGEARDILFDDFKEEIVNYQKGYTEFKQLPFTFEQYAKSQCTTLRTFVDKHVSDHPFNYLYFMHQGGDVVHFLDGHFVCYRSVVKLSPDLWFIEQQHVKYLSREDQSKFKIIDKFFRLHTLFQSN